MKIESVLLKMTEKQLKEYRDSLADEFNFIINSKAFLDECAELITQIEYVLNARAIVAEKEAENEQATFVQMLQEEYRRNK